jgi:hypothetical protein
MDDLITWLRTQLDDDERVAREATQGKWRWADPGGPVKMALVAGTWPIEQMVVPSRTPDVYPSHHDAEHIARWDPARVLAEVDAKRRIMAHIGMVALSPWQIKLPEGYLEDLDRILRFLALPYADREGYRDEWRP